jgi:hypothetical protein
MIKKILLSIAIIFIVFIGFFVWFMWDVINDPFGVCSADHLPWLTVSLVNENNDEVKVIDDFRLIEFIEYSQNVSLKHMFGRRNIEEISVIEYLDRDNAIVYLSESFRNDFKLRAEAHNIAGGVECVDWDAIDRVDRRTKMEMKNEKDELIWQGEGLEEMQYQFSSGDESEKFVFNVTTGLIFKESFYKIVTVNFVTDSELSRLKEEFIIKNELLTAFRKLKGEIELLNDETSLMRRLVLSEGVVPTEEFILKEFEINRLNHEKNDLLKKAEDIGIKDELR